MGIKDDDDRYNPATVILCLRIEGDVTTMMIPKADDDKDEGLMKKNDQASGRRMCKMTMMPIMPTIDRMKSKPSNGRSIQ
jgi:hypothetical protein